MSDVELIPSEEPTETNTKTEEEILITDEIKVEKKEEDNVSLENSTEKKNTVDPLGIKMLYQLTPSEAKLEVFQDELDRTSFQNNLIENSLSESSSNEDLSNKHLIDSSSSGNFSDDSSQKSESFSSNSSSLVELEKEISKENQDEEKIQSLEDKLSQNLSVQRSFKEDEEEDKISIDISTDDISLSFSDNSFSKDEERKKEEILLIVEEVEKVRQEVNDTITKEEDKRIDKLIVSEEDPSIIVSRIEGVIEGGEGLRQALNETLDQHEDKKVLEILENPPEPEEKEAELLFDDNEELKVELNLRINQFEDTKIDEFFEKENASKIQEELSEISSVKEEINAKLFESEEKLVDKIIERELATNQIEINDNQIQTDISLELSLNEDHDGIEAKAIEPDESLIANKIEKEEKDIQYIEQLKVADQTLQRASVQIQHLMKLLEQRDQMNLEKKNEIVRLKLMLIEHNGCDVLFFTEQIKALEKENLQLKEELAGLQKKKIELENHNFALIKASSNPEIKLSSEIMDQLKITSKMKKEDLEKEVIVLREKVAVLKKKKPALIPIKVTVDYYQKEIEKKVKKSKNLKGKMEDLNKDIKEDEKKLEELKSIQHENAVLQIKVEKSKSISKKGQSSRDSARSVKKQKKSNEIESDLFAKNIRKRVKKNEMSQGFEKKNNKKKKISRAHHPPHPQKKAKANGVSDDEINHILSSVHYAPKN